MSASSDVPAAAAVQPYLVRCLHSRGDWATATFKEYNFEALGREPGGGHVHALMKVCSWRRRAQFGP